MRRVEGEREKRQSGNRRGEKEARLIDECCKWII